MDTKGENYRHRKSTKVKTKPIQGKMETKNTEPPQETLEVLGVPRDISPVTVLRRRDTTTE